MEQNNSSSDLGGSSKRISISAKKEKENPFRYFSISKDNLIPLIVLFLGSMFLIFVGYELVSLLTDGYDPSQDMVISGSLVLLLLLFLSSCIQNHKHKVWEKDEQIAVLREHLDSKDNILRNLNGELSQLKTDLPTIKTKLAKCLEEREVKLEEIKRLCEEKDHLQSELNDLRKQLADSLREHEVLETQMHRAQEKLDECISVRKSYEEQVTPSIAIKSFMTDEKGKILGIIKVDDMYNISLENTGSAPAYSIEGEILCHPTVGSPSGFTLSVVKLSPGEIARRPLAGKKTIGECTTIDIDLTYEDILGNVHTFTGQIRFSS